MYDHRLHQDILPNTLKVDNAVSLSNDKIVDDVIKKIRLESIDSINSKIEDAMPEYLSEGWEDEFDDMFEAYDETGRDGAHDQIIAEVIVSTCEELGVEVNTDQYCVISKSIREYLNE